tara:strand:- start:267 stop:932 length:666 start_codon:yes stop_codon:yes gene_type:complete
MVLDFLFGKPKTPSAPKIDYETPDSLKPFINYADQTFIESRGETREFANIIYDALTKGNLDRETASAFLDSRLPGNSDFYTSKKFSKFLNYELPKEDQKEIIQGAAQSNFFRDLNKDDLKAYKTLAQSMGKTGSATELSNFIQGRMATSLEGMNKYKTPEITAKESYYGRALRDKKGNLTGEFAAFGTGKKGAKAARAFKDIGAKSAEFSKNYLKKLGAKS